MAVTYNYGAASTYVKIATYTVPSTAATYTFSNIPQGYSDLVIQGVILSTRTSSQDIMLTT